MAKVVLRGRRGGRDLRVVSKQMMSEFHDEVPAVEDKVNHPAHYKSGGMEAIDVIEAFDLGFCTGNAVKYILRAGKKPGEQSKTDIAKAIWYLQRELSRLEK